MLLLLFVVVGLALVVAITKLQSEVLVWVFFGWGVVGSYMLHRVRCPRCGTSVGYQGSLGRLPIYAGFARRACASCGCDLTVPHDSAA
jgi:hypothetical protein